MQTYFGPESGSNPEDSSIKKKPCINKCFSALITFFCCKVKLNWIFLGINESPYLVTPKDSV